MSNLHVSSTNKDLKVGLRPAREDDVPFLFSSIMKSGICNIESKRFCLCSLLPRKAMLKVVHAYLEEKLPESRIIVCTDPEDADVIWGYVWILDNTVLYCYTKDAHRSLGIATLLLNLVSPERVPDIGPINTPAGRKLLDNYRKQLTSGV